ncbi:MAG: DUF1844 domain-containing protein [Phycisphaerales bacterium]|nr:DUF1844 domain-containing protein [Phycisphaerales bacterium]
MTDTPDGEAPRIHVDSDWKAEAQAEKERLASVDDQKKEADATAGTAPGELPPADFRGLMGLLASQAMMGLGAMGEPESGKVMVDIVGSKYAIDLLGVLHEKTAGNLSEEEAKDLEQVLAELRSRFVQIANLIAAQGAGAQGDPNENTGPSLEIPGS